MAGLNSEQHPWLELTGAFTERLIQKLSGVANLQLPHENEPASVTNSM